jgi:holliday junction DNA helicase RuvA
LRLFSALLNTVGMVDFLQGTIKQLEPTFLVLAVGGIGFSMRISLNTYSELKGKADVLLVHTYLHYSQTDGMSLFGFASPSERSLFLHLISVNGIGPGTALVALSSAQAEPLREAIAREDLRTIQSLKGIGPKTAQRLVLELKDKIRKEMQGATGFSGGPATQAASQLDDALTALMTLGIPKATAEKSLESLVKQTDKTYTTEELIRLVLQRSR